MLDLRAKGGPTTDLGRRRPTVSVKTSPKSMSDIAGKYLFVASSGKIAKADDLAVFASVVINMMMFMVYTERVIYA
jgi:hypothetical protein